MEFVNFLVVGETTLKNNVSFKLNTLFKYPLGKPLTKEILDGIVAQLYVQSQEMHKEAVIDNIILLNICPLGVAEPEEKEEDNADQTN